MAAFAFASSQASFSFVLSGRLAGDLFRRDWEACNNDEAKQEALREENRVACIAALLAKRAFKTALSEKDMICAETTRVAAIKLREAGKPAREKDGTQAIYKQANQKLMLIMEAAGLKKPSASRGARPEGNETESDKPASDKPANDDKALREAIAAYKPETFEKVERYALSAGKAFGFVAKKPDAFEKTETPNRARVIREAMLAFSKAMATLPND